MAKVRITKRFHFEMAHALTDYDGLCRNIHGHSYNLEVTVIGEVPLSPGQPKDGMVIDFQLLKELVKKNIVDRFDHAMMVNSKHDPVQLDLVKKVTNRLVVVDFQPTTENLVVHISGILMPVMPKGVALYSIRLWETVTSFAEWYAVDNEY